MADRAKELALYPYMGDQRMVRPFIRASEGAMGGMHEGVTSQWPERFWKECLDKTECRPLPESLAASPPPIGTTVNRLTEVRVRVVEHCGSTAVTTDVDPRHDMVFGACLFALDMLGELMRFGASTSISARLSLRTLLDVCITLAYLTAKEDMELWRSYRVYGAGQMKLMTLKLDESEEQPFSIPRSLVDDLANEDVWQEFLDIDLGHWAGANLRTLSIQAGVKEDYDQSYAWTSSFAHGHWGSIRATEFDVCANPARPVQNRNHRALYATLLNASTCRSHLSSRFQLVKMRLTTIHQ